MTGRPMAGRGAAGRRSRSPGAGLLRLYPASWRERYESEMLATLEQFELGSGGRFDLARGALDAHLHTPTRGPAAAALLAGGLWTVAGAGVVSQPTPPDWPGYLLETLPLAIVAVVLGGLAIIGCWAPRSDDLGRAGGIALGVAVAGHVAWLIVLAVALVGIDYGLPTAAGQGLAVLGSILVGVVLLRSGDAWLGGLLVLAPSLMLFGWPVAWLEFGLAWTLVGALLLFRFEPGGPPPPLSA